MNSTKIAGWTPPKRAAPAKAGRNLPVPQTRGFRGFPQPTGYSNPPYALWGGQHVPTPIPPIGGQRGTTNAGSPAILNKRNSSIPLVAPTIFQSMPSALIAASGIPVSDLLNLQKLSTPVIVDTTLGPSFMPRANSIQNDAFLAGAPGAIATVQTGAASYTQYQIPDSPPRGTILGGSTIPASLSADGRAHSYNQVADGNGGSYSVQVS